MIEMEAAAHTAVRGKSFATNDPSKNLRKVGSRSN
ncbi:hypothetical protein [Oligoflexus sp.]